MHEEYCYYLHFLMNKCESTRKNTYIKRINSADLNKEETQTFSKARVSSKAKIETAAFKLLFFSSI